MAKIIRSFYADKPLRGIAREVANQAGLDGGGAFDAYEGLHTRRAKGRKRVRITIIVEAAPPPKPRKGAKVKRPVQQSLPLERATCEEQDMGGMECGPTQCCREGACQRHTFTGNGEQTIFRMPLHGADGGAT